MTNLCSKDSQYFVIKMGFSRIVFFKTIFLFFQKALKDVVKSRGQFGFLAIDLRPTTQVWMWYFFDFFPNFSLWHKPVDIFILENLKHWFFFLITRFEEIEVFQRPTSKSLFTAMTFFDLVGCQVQEDTFTQQLYSLTGILCTSSYLLDMDFDT